MTEMEEMRERVKIMCDRVKGEDIGYNIRYDESELGKRLCLLQEVMNTLQKYTLKPLKGKKRYKKMLELFQLIFYYQRGTVKGAEGFLKQEIRETTEIFQRLPQDILDGVSDIEDLFFGDVSKKTYEKLKNFFYQERDDLTPIMKELEEKVKRAH